MPWCLSLKLVKFERKMQLQTVVSAINQNHVSVEVSASSGD